MCKMILKKEDDWNEIIETTEGQIIVYFWAPGSETCESFSSVLKEISDEKKATVIKTNVDDFPEHVYGFSIQSTPTLVFMKDNMVNRKWLIGVQTKEAILNHIA